MIQLIIGTLLLFVLFYGLAFIVDMLLKTTWLPLYLYIALVIVYVYFNWSEGSFLASIRGYTYVDYIPAIGGLIGAYFGSWSIQLLRKKGYKMF